MEKEVFTKIINEEEEIKRRYYKNLLLCLKNLSKDFERKGILAIDRTLFVSGVLLALKQKNFNYSAVKDADLPVALYSAIESGLKQDKKDSIAPTFHFIKEVEKFKEKDSLKHLIKAIDKNILQYVKTEEYYDVISNVYVEFLRSSSNDKGLGIVLTPPHITELAVELAKINKDSKVIDNCCGTGGFLVAAMRKMIRDANFDQQKIKKIKEVQIRGIEIVGELHAICTCNMLIHDNGNTGITKGSCFKTRDSIKYTAGLLNPPFAGKETSEKEWEFVFNSLESIKAGGKCVALLPMGCVIGNSKDIQRQKHRLLKHHTLDGVLSLPDQLFHDSKVGVVTCLVLITANEPHDQTRATWFAYGKDDGFEVKKHKGRIEKEKGSWAKTKSKWLKYFFEKKEEAGFSVMQKVTAGDEWCAEAYMETDYSTLSEDDFVNTLKNYVAFQFLNDGKSKN